jgi:hypothetical protein
MGLTPFLVTSLLLFFMPSFLRYYILFYFSTLSSFICPFFLPLLQVNTVSSIMSPHCALPFVPLSPSLPYPIVQFSKLLLTLSIIIVFGFGPVGTNNHIFVLSRLSCVSKWSLPFDERRCLTTAGHSSLPESDCGLALFHSLIFRTHSHVISYIPFLSILFVHCIILPADHSGRAV